MKEKFINWLKPIEPKKWICYEIHRANMPQYGCVTQCNDCKLKQNEK